MSCSSKWPHVHGASRSIVRRIGSSLPLYSGKRLVVEKHSNRSQDEMLLDGLTSGAEGLVVASYFDETISLDTNIIDPTTEGSTESDCERKKNGRCADIADVQTKEKILSLESELKALKSRIAIYAQAEALRNQVSQPPPPPPPPPLPPATSLPLASMRTPASRRPVSHVNDKCDGVITSRTEMSTVLKDIGSVRLKAAPFARSPGGTPIRKGQDNKTAHDDDDPGAIIARALRQKFSNRVFQDSPDKENLDRSDVSISLGFDSPVAKPVYQTQVDAT